VETEEPSAQRPPLPAELLCDIVSLCEPASLPSLCLANTILREVASPVLYKSLSFCSPTQAETFLHAVSLSPYPFLFPSSELIQRPSHRK
jgi:hypothetical protein